VVTSSLDQRKAWLEDIRETIVGIFPGKEFHDFIDREILGKIDGETPCLHKVSRTIFARVPLELRTLAAIALESPF
jgi:hypothetical protein